MLLERNNSCQLTQCVLLRCRAWFWYMSASCSNFSFKQKYVGNISITSDFLSAQRDGYGREEHSESPYHKFTLEKWEVQKQYDKQEINSQDSLIRCQPYWIFTFSYYCIMTDKKNWELELIPLKSYCHWIWWKISHTFYSTYDWHMCHGILSNIFILILKSDFAKIL